MNVAGLFAEDSEEEHGDLNIFEELYVEEEELAETCREELRFREEEMSAKENGDMGIRCTG